MTLVGGDFRLVIFESRFVDKQSGVFASRDQRLARLRVTRVPEDQRRPTGGAEVDIHNLPP